MTRPIGKAIKINVSLPPEFLRNLDKWAKVTSQGRSEFIREAVRHYVIYLREKGVDKNGLS